MTTTLPPALADIASQAEAEAGTATDKFMTPERDRQALIASGGRVLLETQTADNTSGEITFTSNIDSTYNHYILEVIGMTVASNGVSARIQTSNDGVSFDSGASDYDWSITAAYSTSGSGPFNDSSSADTHIELMRESSPNGIGNDAQNSFDGTYEIFNPSDTNFYTKLKLNSTFITDALAQVNVRGSGYRSAAEAVAGIRFFLSSGNIEAGTFKLYGMNR